MHPHISFEPYPSYSKLQPYNQQPLSVQQKGPLSPVPAYNTRNNYHYNYSPSQNFGQKHNMNSSVQEPFYRRQDKAEYPRPQSGKYRGENVAGNYRYQANFNIQVSSSPITHRQTTNFLGEFSSSLFPNTSKMLNLQKFVEQNVKLRKKLLQELQKIKQKNTNLKFKTIISQQQQKTKTSTRDTTPKRFSKDKSSTLFDKRQKPQTTPNLKSSQQTPTQEQQITQLLQLKTQKQHEVKNQKHTLQQLQKSNTQKRQHLHKIQSQFMNQSIHETPLLREKQLAIQCLSVEIEWINEKNMEMKRLVGYKNGQNGVFEMYEKMCRQVESLRKENNKKSERLKKLFEKTNQLTNKEENVNMFLMNLKV